MNCPMCGELWDRDRCATCGWSERKRIEDAERCGRCRHPQSWHSHDDVACRTKHEQPCYPENAPFRCLGTDIWKPGAAGGTPETRCGCPDFVEPPKVLDTKAAPSVRDREGR